MIWIPAPDCCGHSTGAHECGLCQIILNELDYMFGGAQPQFCPCPMNDYEFDEVQTAEFVPAEDDTDW